MLLDEARLAARIRHPNVVPMLDVVSVESPTGDELFLVMEYVHGESLARLAKLSRLRGENVPIEIAASVVSHALHGLHAAHEAKSERGTPLDIVHRDVSPQNILVGVDGIGRVLDFGIAKATSRLQVTLEGQLKGKLAYMAPEQLEPHDVDRRVDIWAASVVLWELLTGRRLFHGDHPARVMKSVLSLDIERPSAIAADIPRDLDDLVMRGLSRDPAGRFATAREMAVALERTGVVATQATIGAWVERIAADSLATRADTIAEIEGTANTGPAIQLREASTFSATESPASEAPPPRSRRAYLAAGAIALLIAGGLFVATRAPSEAPAKAAPVTSAFEVPSPPPASTSIVAPSPAPSPSIAQPTASAKPKIAAPKPKQPSKDCNPPYTIDKDGVKIPKLQCL
jgi:serine/threonine-protein kinase